MLCYIWSRSNLFAVINHCRFFFTVFLQTVTTWRIMTMTKTFTLTPGLGDKSNEFTISSFRKWTMWKIAKSWNWISNVHFTLCSKFSSFSDCSMLTAFGNTSRRSGVLNHYTQVIYFYVTKMPGNYLCIEETHVTMWFRRSLAKGMILGYCRIHAAKSRFYGENPSQNICVFNNRKTGFL